MRTRCPNCQTLYQLNDSELKATHGLASCFGCKRAFNAWENETEDNAPGLAPVVGATTHEDDISILEEKPEKPAILEDDWDEILTTTTAKPPEPVIPKPAAPKPVRPKPVEMPEPEFIMPKGLPPIAPTATDSNPLLLRKPQKQKIKSKYGFLKAVLLVVLLTLVLGQLAWIKRDKLLADSRVRDLVSQACQYLNCQTPLQRNISKITVLKRNLTPAPNDASSLRLQITIRNDADFTQTLPDVQLTLTDFSNNVIARQLFTAQQYQASAKQIAPQMIADITVLMNDPGWQAAGFQIEFY